MVYMEIALNWEKESNLYESWLIKMHDDFMTSSANEINLLLFRIKMKKEIILFKFVYSSLLGDEKYRRLILLLS